ncbi:MAG: hypothetical protein IJN67_01385 [Oscillospiraceae bacterium]|nr:hypothetical protein [Oscillospiraceae bacterium]
MKLLKGILWGLLVSLGGWVFAALFAATFNGLEFGAAVTSGFVVYLTVVVVACTYLLYHKK